MLFPHPCFKYRDIRRGIWMILYFLFRFVILTLQSISNICLTECQFTDWKITERSNIRFLQDYPLPYWRWFFWTSHSQGHPFTLPKERYYSCESKDMMWLKDRPMKGRYVLLTMLADLDNKWSYQCVQGLNKPKNRLSSNLFL